MIKKLVLFCALVFPCVIFSQEEKSKTKIIDDISGSVSVTNNGISLVPTFSLGDPAAQFNLKLAKKNFSFEPEMRFALEGKPWSFLFWFRHQTIKTEKFKMRLGIHPALNFRSVTVIENETERTLIESRRYLAAEVVPSYKLSENISIGMYYLISKGFDDGLKNGHFLSLNMGFSNIPIAKNGAYYLNITPQIYYLNLDLIDGIYTSAFITLAKNEFPFSLQFIFNEKLNSNIVSKDFVWNISLAFTF
jgi:hypothetical protein